MNPTILKKIILFVFLKLQLLIPQYLLLINTNMSVLVFIL